MTSVTALPRIPDVRECQDERIALPIFSYTAIVKKECKTFLIFKSFLSSVCIYFAMFDNETIS